MGVEVSQDFEEGREALRQRFPDLRCVRCGSEKFLMRIWSDASLSPALRDNRMMEIICENCGFIERHALEGLKGNLKPAWEKAAADDGR